MSFLENEHDSEARGRFGGEDSFRGRFAKAVGLT